MKNERIVIVAANQQTYADDQHESSVGFLDSESERNEQDGDRGECLEKGMGGNQRAFLCSKVLNRPTLSIWMNETLRLRYAKLDKIRLPEKSAPMGRMVRIH